MRGILSLSMRLLVGIILFGTVALGAQSASHGSVPLAAGNFERSAALTLNAGEAELDSAVIDTANGFAYFGTGTTPAKIVKVRLSDFTRVGALTLEADERSLTAAAIDTANGFAYFGTYTNPAKIIKVNLSTFTRVGALTLDTSERSLTSALLDSARGFMYVSTDTRPGTVVKIRLSDFTRVGALAFGSGEDYPASAVLDAANGFAYYGTWTSPGRVVKVRLSDFTRVGALTFFPTEDNLTSAVMDTANGFAYFGTRTDPGMIVKVRLSDFTRVGAIRLELGEDYLTTAVIDTSTPANPIAYFGTETSAGYVVKVRLFDLTRIGAVWLDDREDDLHSAVIDPANGFAYFGTDTDPGRVVRVRLSGEPLPDLVASIRAPTSPASTNVPLSYTLVVNNGGALLASGVTLTATLPSNMRVNGVIASQGQCAGTGTLVCELGTIVAGGRAEVSLHVTMLQAGVANLSFNVRASQPELNLANNSASQGTNVSAGGASVYLPLVLRDSSGSSPTPPAPVTATVTLPPTITLTTASNTVVPTGTLGLQWQTRGDLSGLNLRIRAQEPGSIIPSTLTNQPGALPPTGRVFYLQANNTWTQSPVSYLGAASAGGTTIGMPSTVEGEWRFDALLQDSSASVVANSARTVLSTSRPRIMLNRSRAIANGDDRVTVELLSAAGGSTQDVQIIASLALNDGSEVPLPSLVPGSPVLYSGPALNSRFTLLDRALGFYGEGIYLIQASLVVSGTGQILNTAALGVQVCNTASTLSGIVSARSGAPLGGNGATLALVSALDVDDASTAASSTIAANGSYALSLPAGRYRISAIVEDAAGHHQIIAPEVLEVGCGGGALALNLSENATLMRAQSQPQPRAASAAPASAASATASDGLPKPTVFAHRIVNNLLPSDIPQNTSVISMTADFKGWLVTAAANQIDLLTVDEFRLLMQTAAVDVMSGEEFDLNSLSTQISREFLLELEFARDAVGTYVRGSIIDTKDLAIVRRADLRGNPITPGMVLQLASQLGIGLFQDLRGVQERPIVPTLSLTLNNTSAQPGGALNATITLKDMNGTAAAGAPVNLLYWPAGRSTLDAPERIGGVTDASGRFTTAFPVGSMVGRGYVDAQYVRRNIAWCVQSRACRGSQIFRVTPPSDLSLNSSENQLRAFESTQVCASLQRDGSGVSGAQINLSALGGYGVPNFVTTGSDGRACFVFTVNATGAVASIFAQYSDPQNGQISYADLPFSVLGSVDAILSAFPTTVLNNNVSALSMRITMGGQPQPALPVRLETSAGTVAFSATQTDDDGRINLNYLAPSGGQGVATITATANIADLYVTRTTSVEFRPLACQPPAGVSCYNVTPITDTNFYPLRLAENGKVLGYGPGAGTSTLYFKSWQNGAITTGGALTAPSGLQSGVSVMDVNEAGHAVGQGYLPNCSGYYCARAVRWLGAGGSCPAFEGQPPDCATNSPAVQVGDPLGMNANGDIALTSMPNIYVRQGLLWPSSTAYVTIMDYVTNGYTYTLGSAFRLNASRQAAFVPSQGGSNIAGKIGRWQLSGDIGQLTIFGTLGGNFNRLNDINNSGAIVGQSNGHAFYAGGGSLSDLGTLGGGSSSASALNSSGQIVGSAENLNGQNRAFVYIGGMMYDLNRLVDYSPTEFIGAVAINASGQILVSSNSGYYYLLTPR